MISQRIDFSKAAALVDAYVAAMTDPSPHTLPARISSRSWLEPRMEALGVIEDVRRLRFGETHAIWYACLIHTKRVREISRMESRLIGAPRGTTEHTIKRMLTGNLRSNHSAVILRELIESC